MRTVKDVLDQFGHGIFFHRHGTYLMNPEGKNNPADTNLLAAMNYAREFPDHNNPLDQNGRDISVKQGAKLVELGIKLVAILVSRQGRGPETGLYLGIGYLNATGVMPKINYSVGADYPVYSSKEAVLEAERKYGQQFPAHWLNGKLPGLCQVEPYIFAMAIQEIVDHWEVYGKIVVGTLYYGNIFVATHFENITYVYGHWVARKKLGKLPTDWVPTKSAGVLLVKDQKEVRGFEYDPEFNIVE